MCLEQIFRRKSPADIENQIILVDDSSSMKRHRNELKRIAKILGYMVKGSDKDGIELRFTISEQRYNFKHTTQLVNVLETQRFEGKSNIRRSLKDIVQGYKDKLDAVANPKRSRWSLGGKTSEEIRKQNVYVLTDGIWQPGYDPTEIIESLISDLQKHKVVKEQFGIQFISFGDDPGGLAVLNHLDSGLNLPMCV